MSFNNIEIRIINILYQHQSALTTGKVVKYTRYSYNTVKKYLSCLAEQGYVKYTHYGNALYWWLKEAK